MGVNLEIDKGQDGKRVALSSRDRSPIGAIVKRSKTGVWHNERVRVGEGW
jgi:hypothetical protein